MNLTTTIGRMLGYGDVSKIDSARVSFGSAWAHGSPAMVMLGCLALSTLAVWFYLRWQARGHRPTRLFLATLRSVALCLLLLVLADPILELTFVSLPKPVLWLLLDGSDSMSIPDELPEGERTALAKAVDLTAYQSARSVRPSRDEQRESSRSGGSSSQDHPARADYARAFLAKADRNMIISVE